MPITYIWKLLKECYECNKANNEKKEKIGCPITLGEYEKIVEEEKENKE
jgi:hypothetical protein